MKSRMLIAFAALATFSAEAEEGCAERIEGMPVVGKVASRGIGPHTSKMWMLG